MILWDGSCIVHEAFSMERIAQQLADHPNAKLIAHPESETPVLDRLTLSDLLLHCWIMYRKTIVRNSLLQLKKGFYTK